MDTVELANRTNRCAAAITYARDVFGAWYGPTPEVYLARTAFHEFPQRFS